MFKELEKYKNQNKFIFSINNELDIVCNAPSDGNGIYLVYSLVLNEKELIYVGSTGTVQNNGNIKVKIGGLYEKIVNGHQFGKQARKESWPTQMKNENLETLEIHWVETFNNETKDIPTFIEGLILQKHLDENRVLPRWNIAF